MKHPPVVIKKLGREKAWAFYTPDGTIELDPRTKGKTLLRVLIHEYLHHEHPEWTEEKVHDLSLKIGDFLWKQGYRKP